MLIKQFLVTLIPLIILDGVWLFLTRSFYTAKLGYLMADHPKWVPVILFYLLYAIAITVFISVPAQAQNVSFIKIFLLGALLGLAAYGAYDFTNHAIIKDWPIIVTIIDMAWGGILTGLVSVVSVLLARMY